MDNPGPSKSMVCKQGQEKRERTSVLHKLHTVLWVLAASTALSMSRTAVGQCQFEWRSGNGIPGVNGPVRAVALWDPDGSGPLGEVLAVGGSFTVAGGALASNIAMWDGAAWHALGSGVGNANPIDYSAVDALAIYDGKLVAGGHFLFADGMP